MYHHVNSDRCSNNLEIFGAHLQYLAQNYTSVLPGEEVTAKSVCLTFDDAYADFYYFIFPMLKEYNLKALLAVPTKYILEETNYTKDIRLDFEHNDLFHKYAKATFCTFTELREIIDSGLVQIASHSHSHTNLLEDNVDLEEELVTSKHILEDKLNIKVNNFVFPFGKYNDEIAKEAHKHYKYLFRIGNAIHKDFSGIKGIIYRVDGDNLAKIDALFSFKNQLKYHFKAFIKKI